MQVTRQQAIQISKEIEGAVEAIFAAHGLEKPRVNSRYGAYLTVKLEASPMVEGENGVNAASVEATDYITQARYSGLDPEAVGKVYTLRGQDYVFIGVAYRSRKYPYLFRRVSDGKTYKFTSFEAETVLRSPVTV